MFYIFSPLYNIFNVLQLALNTEPPLSNNFLMLFFIGSQSYTAPNFYIINAGELGSIVNSEEFGARSDGATPISNRRATSDNVTNSSSIDY
ncbi:palindromic element RPE2 domain-containing protein [Candidatus Tisiphia endosymbiont of Mystacides longicornis]|uniref:palindromic element RPE2 domain-containing protein n=2 Tax=unclassified Candidatus Tisiphia TaxID=2996318 RepID=UPI003CCB09DD